jgi:HSP20 family protein
MCGTQFCYVEQPETKEKTYFRAPAVDILEADDHFEIKANLPGVAKENVKVNVQNSQLVIEGKVDAPVADETKYILQERRKGDFSRRFNLGDTIDTESIDAGYENGVLTVVLKKKAEVQPKSINIK